MAEYYPLLAKAVGSLPNSTSESRRVVYERARKALIGQLRTMHPPVPDEDIERESVELDRAIERVETELAAAPAAQPASPPPPLSMPPSAPPVDAPPSPAPASPMGALGPVARKPIMPLRPPVPRAPRAPAASSTPEGGPAPDAAGVRSAPPAGESPVVDAAAVARDVTPFADSAPAAPADAEGGNGPAAPRRAAPHRADAAEPQRSEALDVDRARGRRRGHRRDRRRRGLELRVRPETMARTTPSAPQQSDTGKIADRVGGSQSSDTDTASTPGQTPAAPTGPASEPEPQPTAPPTQTAKQEIAPPPINPAVPVAYRAALLVEAPDLPSKVQTFPGTVVWKLNNVNAGPSDAVGLSVEASIDLPQDKTKATVVFERNTDSSLPASHTIKVRFTIDPGSYSGDVKQISVPQMRREGNSDGEPLAGVTVPVIQNSFLVGLSPGNAETANLRLIGDLPWVDVPILLASGKIAKLTFEKGAAGQRDIGEALAYWLKQ